jgi:hypothetical protein
MSEPLAVRRISKGHSYVAIIDAGSSGTRLYVYRYATDNDDKTITPLELTLAGVFSSTRIGML